MTFFKNKKLLLLILAGAMLACILNVCVIIPIFSSLQSNVLYAYSFLTDCLHAISKLLDLIFYFAVYAVLIFAVYVWSDKKSIYSFLGYTSGALFLRNLISFVVDIITHGFSISDIGLTLLYLALSILLDLAQLAVIFAIAFPLAKANHKLVAKKRIAAQTVGLQDFSEASNVFPFEKVVDMHSPLLKPAFFASLMYAVLAILSRIGYDIGLGEPSSLAETFSIILGYFSDLFLSVIGYILIVLIFILLFRLTAKENKYNKNEKEV